MKISAVKNYLPVVVKSPAQGKAMGHPTYQDRPALTVTRPLVESILGRPLLLFPYWSVEWNWPVDFFANEEKPTFETQAEY